MALIRSTMVLGSPAEMRLGCETASDVGIDWSRNTDAPAPIPPPAARPAARWSVASWTSSSTSCVMRCSAWRSRMPSSTRNFGKRITGSRAASASRSALVLYRRSSSESECEYGRMHVRVHQRRALALAAIRSGCVHRACRTPGNRCRPPLAGTGPGSPRPGVDMLPPAVCASTGTEMA